MISITNQIHFIPRAKKPRIKRTVAEKTAIILHSYSLNSHTLIHNSDVRPPTLFGSKTYTGVFKHLNIKFLNQHHQQQ